MLIQTIKDHIELRNLYRKFIVANPECKPEISNLISSRRKLVVKMGALWLLSLPVSLPYSFIDMLIEGMYHVNHVIQNSRLSKFIVRKSNAIADKHTIDVEYEISLICAKLNLSEKEFFKALKGLK